MPVIDDSDATPLPPSFLAPADFSNSTCSTDHISLIRSQTERQLQGSVFFIREQLPDPPREWRRLKKLAYCIRHWLSPSNPRILRIWCSIYVPVQPAGL